MIEEQAIVVDIDDQYVWVETQRQSSCGHCQVKDGCGTQVLSQILGNKHTRVRCLNSLNASTGEEVVIGIKESTLLTGSFLLYLLPLIFMIFSGALAVAISKFFWPDFVDLFSVAASFSGLFLGLFFSRHYVQSAKNQKNYEPVLIKIIPQSITLHKCSNRQRLSSTES